MTRPDYHVDVATTALPAQIAQPPGGIQTAGFPPHSKFASAWANWLFNYCGAWSRELDQSRLAAVDVLTDLQPQLLQGSGGGFALPTGSGLLNLLPTDGGAYVVLGRRVSITAAELTAKYPTGWTLPNGSTVYAHLREETSAGGSSTGDLLISTNAVEPGYEQIWTGTTDATDLVSQATTAQTALQWTAPIDMSKRLSITDSTNETAFEVFASNTFVPGVYVHSTLGGTAIQADIGASSGTGFATSVEAAAGIAYSAVLTDSLTNGAGYSALLFGAGNDAEGVTVQHAGTGQGVRVVHTGTGNALYSEAQSTGLAAQFVGGSNASAVTVTGGATQALNATGSGSGAGIRAASGATAGANALNAVTSNTSGFAVNASTIGGALSTARAVKATANGSAIAGEFISADNYALTVQGDTSSPQFGEMHFAGQNADPVQVFDGAMMWHTVQRQLKLSDANDGTFRGVWTSIGGHTHGQSITSFASTSGGVTWVNAGTVALTGSNGPKQANRVLEVQWRAEVQSLVAVANTLNVRLRDPASVVDIGFGPGVLVARTGTGSGNSAGFLLPDPSTSWQRNVELSTRYTIPAAGDRTIVAEIQTATASNIRVRDAVLTCDGLH